MGTNLLRFALLMLFGLLAGTMFGIWVGYDPASLTASAYVEQQQNAIRALNTLLPAIGAVCILLSLTLAFRSEAGSRSRYLFFAAAALMIVAALVTRFGNQPINAVVMTWTPPAPAANWAELRDQWWQWHVVRSVSGIAALALVVIAALGARSAAR